MSTKKQSWDRLRAEKWCNHPALAWKNDPTSKFQKLSDGSGLYVYDEYSVIIWSMPKGLSAEAYLKEFSVNPNKAVKNSAFNAVNVFTKRRKAGPAIGDIYDIDILGPDNGSIVLVDISPGFGTVTGSSWFDIQTISCEKYGTHPENGAREFGFEYVKEEIKFYTRGVSRPGNIATRIAGAMPQMMGWTTMMKGISETIQARGGAPKLNSFTAEKVQKA